VALSFALPIGEPAPHGPHRQAVERIGAAHPRSTSNRRRTRKTLARSTRRSQRGILWILLTGAPWKDLPERYPPYQTCQRRFQKWIEEGVLGSVLETLAQDLEERGQKDLSECYLDGTFVIANKGGSAWERPSGAKVRNSWRFQTALLFLSPSTQRVLARTSSPLLCQIERLFAWLQNFRRLVVR
jgi:transposase